MSIDMEHRIRNVTAVLGPTNTGKTYLAIERMLGHDSGMIGLPLRLLAREVYDRIVVRAGIHNVALITGEEKIKPEGARYWVCTVEAMPRDVSVDFLAIDEVQLAADPERGHVFTDRLLNARGKLETLLLGAGTMRDCIADLVPGANFISRPRLSKLTYAGEKKITRLPPRSAIVAFSAAEVYAVAELIRRQRGGAAVVLGALSPRTRNAQVALYQSGDVEFLVATDAVGMGLNLDVDHVAFAALRKFDGQVHRNLTPGELGQIAGRAGRHMNDGTFGVTGGTEPLSADLIERLENHTFDPIKTLQWRTRELDFGSLEALRDSLKRTPREVRLQRARMSDDTTALENVSADSEVVAFASNRAQIERLWDICQVPDYRKISTQNHAELVGTLFKFLSAPEGRLPEDWFAKQVAFSDRTDGDIDTLSNRLAHIRTWTFVANRVDWLRDPVHWQDKTREIEDRLSDALHECLTQRFVDRRTSALMKGLKDKDDMQVEIAADGAVKVEEHYVGRLKGFRFKPDSEADGVHGKAARAAASHVLAKELVMRARRVASAKADAFKLTRTGGVMWRDEEIAELQKGDDPLRPQLIVLADEHLSGPDKERVQERLNTWLTETIAERLKPLVDIAKAEDVAGLARGIAFRLTESFGILRREAVAEEVRTLDQPARAQLRKYGVRFGAFNIYFPLLLKPAAAELARVLWTLRQVPAPVLAEAPRPGLTSVVVDKAVPETFYRASGYQVCGPRAVRIDMLERLADLIRPLLAWRAKPDNPSATPPKGSTGNGGFTVIPEMMSILGCSGDELAQVLKALGFRVERRPAPVKPVEVAPVVPVTTPAAEPAPDATVTPASAGNEDLSEIADDSAPAETPTEAPIATVASAAVASEADAPPVTPVAAPEPAAGADASEVSAARADTASVPAEPAMIDVWRPKRRHEARAPQAAGEAKTDRADSRGERRPYQGRRDRARDGERGPRPATAASAVGAVEAASPAGAPVAPDAAKPAPSGDQRRNGHDRGGPDRGGAGRGGQGRPNAERGGERRDHRKPWDKDKRPPREDRARPATHVSAPARSRGPDPDSPFAALGSLKAALEEKSKK